MRHKAPQHRRRRDARGEPLVDQGILNGFSLSWNPDDDRYYIQRGEDTVAAFRHWRNATTYARRHTS